MSGPEFTVALVVGAAVVAFLMKTLSKKEPDSVERLLDEVSVSTGEDAEEGSAPHEVAPMCSDGLVFLARGDGIVLVPVKASTSAEDLGADPDRPRSHGDSLTPGELIAARIRRGAPDHDPWRLEALGRDREYRAWRFETDDAARAALAMVEQRIVRVPLDEDGEPVRIGDADFAEARRIEEDIERELAQGDAFDDEPHDPLR